MQISTTRHSSTISMELAFSPAPLGIITGVRAVAACAGGLSGGCGGEESVEPASLLDCGPSEPVVASVAVPVPDSAIPAISALSMAALPIAVACGASACSASAAIDDAGRSRIGEAPVFSMTAEPKLAGPATIQPTSTTVNAAAVAHRRGFIIGTSKVSIVPVNHATPRIFGSPFERARPKLKTTIFCRKCCSSETRCGHQKSSQRAKPVARLGQGSALFVLHLMEQPIDGFWSAGATRVV